VLTDESRTGRRARTGSRLRLKHERDAKTDSHRAGRVAHISWWVDAKFADGPPEG
jgi:hypothetical protein